jgi:S-disulfanyl-L-cysteine oxidoreductase SoxD
LRSVVLLGTVIASAFASVSQANDFGQPAIPQEIQRWDIDVRPDGTGLPPGSGTAARGQAVYQANCQVCHGVNRQGGLGGQLAGGQGTLTSATPVKTVGSYWPYVPTLFDYVHRAMPYRSRVR